MRHLYQDCSEVECEGRACAPLIWKLSNWQNYKDYCFRQKSKFWSGSCYWEAEISWSNFFFPNMKTLYTVSPSKYLLKIISIILIMLCACVCLCVNLCTWVWAPEELSAIGSLRAGAALGASVRASSTRLCWASSIACEVSFHQVLVIFGAEMSIDSR